MAAMLRLTRLSGTMVSNIVLLLLLILMTSFHTCDSSTPPYTKVQTSAFVWSPTAFQGDPQPATGLLVPTGITSTSQPSTLSIKPTTPNYLLSISSTPNYLLSTSNQNVAGSSNTPNYLLSTSNQNAAASSSSAAAINIPTGGFQSPTGGFVSSSTSASTVVASNIVTATSTISSSSLPASNVVTAASTVANSLLPASNVVPAATTSNSVPPSILMSAMSSVSTVSPTAAAFFSSTTTVNPLPGTGISAPSSVTTSMTRPTTPALTALGSTVSSLGFSSSVTGSSPTAGVPLPGSQFSSTISPASLISNTFSTSSQTSNASTVRASTPGVPLPTTTVDPADLPWNVQLVLPASYNASVLGSFYAYNASGFLPSLAYRLNVSSSRITGLSASTAVYANSSIMLQFTVMNGTVMNRTAEDAVDNMVGKVGNGTLNIMDGFNQTVVPIYVFAWTDAGPCPTQSCQNGGVCAPINLVYTSVVYCDCVSPYEGTYCDFNPDTPVTTTTAAPGQQAVAFGDDSWKVPVIVAVVVIGACSLLFLVIILCCLRHRQQRRTKMDQSRLVESGTASKGSVEANSIVFNNEPAPPIDLELESNPGFKESNKGSVARSNMYQSVGNSTLHGPSAGNSTLRGPAYHERTFTDPELLHRATTALDHQY